MLDSATLETLRRRAFDLRIDDLNAIGAAESGHPGGTLSAIDLLQTLYFVEMKHRPNEPHWPERDRFVLCNRHAVPALYTVLAHAGYFSTDLLLSLRQLGSPLQGHPANFLLPGVEASTGSLGQGLSVAVGMALGAKLDGSAARVYVLIGDGEAEAGQIWEAARCAPKYELGNLCVILDHHQPKIEPTPLEDRWRAFNFNVLSIDGHDYRQIAGAFGTARATNGKPTFIIAETVQGKGVSFLENATDGHERAPNKAQLAQAVGELRAAQAGLAPSSKSTGGAV